MSRHDVDRAIAKVARRQHGVFSIDQVRALGATKTMVRTRVEIGEWVRLARGVYALASHPATWRRQYKAAELSKPGSAICGRPAAMVHGLEGAKVLRPELVVAPGTSVRSSIASVHEGRDVPVAMVDGIRVTTLAQTLLDLLAHWPVDAVERAFDGALLAGVLDLAACEERADTLAGTRRRDLVTFAALIEARRAGTYAPPESELEHALLALLAGLPSDVTVERQCPFPWWPTGPSRVDFLIRSWRLILEADGRRWHARVADFDRDRWRDNTAQAHGYRVLRFTHAHVTQRPGEVFNLVVGAGRWRPVAA
jgi:very-short-patch-repair endonuclease